MADDSYSEIPMALDAVMVSKLKVQQLKRELKLRGLSTTGNKNELIERLQNSLEPNGLISSESVDDLEEDLLNGDDDEHLEGDSVILDTDLENELTKVGTKRKLEDTDKSDVQPEVTAPPPKKVVLNRNTSIEAEETPLKEKEAPKEVQPTEKKVIKLSQLTAKERLEMRAKKFGVNAFSDEAKKLVRAERFGTSNSSSSSISSNKVSTSVDVLKQRAERFGGSVSSVMSSLENQEKLEKRKARFGLTMAASTQDKGKVPVKV